MSSSRAFRKQKVNRSPSQPRPAPAGGARRSWRWPTILALLLATTAGTWAACEFWIFSKIPSELVGKWVVTGGPQEGATFDFFPNGTMVGRVNIEGKEGIVNASVEMEGKTLHWLTQSKSGQVDRRVKFVRTLTAGELVLEDEQGQVLRMERAE